MKLDKLDRTQPFGTISGDTEGRVYEQNHKFYSADECVMGEPAEVEAVKPKKAPAAKTEADEQLAAQLGAV